MISVMGIHEYFCDGYKLQGMLSGALLCKSCTWFKISPSYFGALKVTINSM